MKGTADESVGEKFSVDQLQRARDRTLKVIESVASQIEPGMNAAHIKDILQQTQESFGAAKSWHPPQIRLGENTLLPFGQKGTEDLQLSENDIFFLDIGPIFDGHEGDVGRTFAVGNDPDMQKCSRDVEMIWQEVRDHWKEHKVSGPNLYKFARESADKHGWILALDQANGHRIADFPHAVRNRGSIESFEAHPAADRWILEIQIRHPEKPFGAFYEDLLN